MNLVSYYRPTLIVGAFLAVQGLLASLVAHSPPTPLALPLERFPVQLGPGGRWTMIREDQLDPQEAQVLRADRVLVRAYAAPAPAQASGDVGERLFPMHLMVAYFEAQGQGRTPHSPKNCLPGSGFEPVESSIIQVAGNPVNRYLLARDDSRILMLYWYQSGRRAVASEYSAKLFLVNDALLHQRTETAIVRVSVPLRHAADTRTEEEALAFAGAVQAAVLPHLAK